MRYWRDNGTPVEKLRMGFAAYGRTFRLTSSNTGVAAPASGPASAGPYTREAGFWSYYEVKKVPLYNYHMFHISIIWHVITYKQCENCMFKIQSLYS